MLRRFFKRLLIGAAALAAAVLAVKVTKKVLAPKRAVEETAEVAAVPDFRDYDGIVSRDGLKASRQDLQQFAEDYFSEFSFRAEALLDSGDFIHDEEMQTYLLRRMAGRSHDEALGRSPKPKARVRLWSIDVASHIDDFQALIPFPPVPQFEGFFDDDFLIPRLHRRSVPELRNVTLKMHTAGTREFHAAYAYLGNDVAQAYLVPRAKLKTTIEEDHVLQARAGLFQLGQPMDLDKWQGDMFGPKKDEDKFLKNLQRTLVRSANSGPADIKKVLTADWRHEIDVALDILKTYVEGYTDEAKDRFKLYLAAVIIVRNRTWGLGGSDVSLYLAPALFRYCVTELRRIIWTEESLQEVSDDPDMEPYTKEDAAEYFERFLNAITIPHPRRGDVLRHTPMKVVRYLTLDMERV